MSGPVHYADWRRARRCATVYLSWSTGPRGRVSPARSPGALIAMPNLVALRGGDRTRPFGRRSYARPSANPAQGNLISMPQIAASAKFEPHPGRRS